MCYQYYTSPLSQISRLKEKITFLEEKHNKKINGYKAELTKYSDIEEENSVCVEKIKILQEELARTNEEIKKLNEKIKTDKKKNDEKTKEILSIKMC